MRYLKEQVHRKELRSPGQQHQHFIISRGFITSRCSCGQTSNADQERDPGRHHLTMGIKPSWDKPSWGVTVLVSLLLMIALTQWLGSAQVSGAHPRFLLRLPPAVGQDGKV